MNPITGHTKNRTLSILPISERGAEEDEIISVKQPRYKSVTRLSQASLAEQNQDPKLLDLRL